MNIILSQAVWFGLKPTKNIEISLTTKEKGLLQLWLFDQLINFTRALHKGHH